MSSPGRWCPFQVVTVALLQGILPPRERLRAEPRTRCRTLRSFYLMPHMRGIAAGTVLRTHRRISHRRGFLSRILSSASNHPESQATGPSCITRRREGAAGRREGCCPDSTRKDDRITSHCLIKALGDCRWRGFWDARDGPPAKRNVQLHIRRATGLNGCWSYKVERAQKSTRRVGY